MKTINEELEEAIQNIADNYGVAIKRLSIDWTNVCNIDESRFTIYKIETSDSMFINKRN